MLLDFGVTDRECSTSGDFFYIGTKLFDSSHDKIIRQTTPDQIHHEAAATRFAARRNLNHHDEIELLEMDAFGEELRFRLTHGEEDGTIHVCGEDGEKWVLHAQQHSECSQTQEISESGLTRAVTSMSLFARSTSPTDSHEELNKHVDFAAKILGLRSGDDVNEQPTILVRLFAACQACLIDLREKAYQPHGSHGCVGRFVRGKGFEYLCMSIITFNVFFIAWSADQARDSLTESSNSRLRKALDLFFCIFYTIELGLKICVQRLYFFLGEEWQWNSFDFFLVATAIHDEVVDAIGDGSGGGVSFLRILRVMKMMKLLRMIRLMRMFRELRLIMNAIAGSMKSMLWSMVLIAVVLFMFSVFFMQACTDFLEKEGDGVNPSVRQEIDSFWGSVVQSMLSMYMASMSGEDWIKIARPLEDIGWLYYGAFLLYIGFYECVVANTLTSLFVESTMANADKDQQELINAELENKDQYVRMLQSWYESLDRDNSGTLTYAEIVDSLDAPEMMAFAAQMGIDALDVKQFFTVLSCNGRRAVDLETFVVGCIKLKGMAKSMDLMDLTYAHRQAAADQQRFAEFVELQFEYQRAQFEQLSNLLRPSKKGSSFLSERSSTASAKLQSASSQSVQNMKLSS
jgi:hypothetical protein